MRNFLNIVKAALWERPFEWPVEQTDELVRLCAAQGVGPLVFPSVLTQENIPSAARMQMKNMCLHTMQEHVRLRFTLERAWTALTAAGIQPVLMKGAGLASLYPRPEMRQWGDIDLFVGKEQYHPACAVMRDTFPGALKFDEELDHYKHYNLIADGISIEVHRVSMGVQHPVDVRRYDRMEQEGMTHTCELVLDDLTVRVPEPTFNALFVFFHSWEHMLTKGANLRQLCDLTLLLNRMAQQIELPRLGRMLNSLHLMDVWQLYMYILVEHLGLPVPQAPFYSSRCGKRAERLLDDLLHGRLDNTQVSPSPAPSNRLLRKLHTMRERLRDARRFVQYSPSYARHMRWTILLHGASRLFAKDRHWE